MDALPRIAELRSNFVEPNDLAARRLRVEFARQGVFVVSLVSAAGSGKTTLLEATLRALSDKYRAAAIVGDLATDIDAHRLERTGAAIRQINTETVSHLEAQMVQSALTGWEPAGLQLLFIENIGNLVSPADFDLGENLRLVLLSVTEGEDKPVKYPRIFQTSDVAIITKLDLARAVEFDFGALRDNIEKVHAGMPVLDISLKTGDGVDKWIALLEQRMTGARSGSK